jgi:murein DD-endopeptidase MepM/ murein hydrolase activator NlpD
LFTSASAQTLYKYRGENGEWIYTDRPMTGGAAAEVRNLGPGSSEEKFSVSHGIEGNAVEIRAKNPLYVPVEVTLRIDEIEGLEYPDPDAELRWTVNPRDDLLLMSLAVLDSGLAPSIEYRYEFLAGDPSARHDAGSDYRVPYAKGADYQITQAFPDVTTHNTADSRHAIDIAMPIGTDVFAARGGVVFDVASTNFKSGTDIEKFGHKANVVRILHDDGTYAVYAHLNWNSIRVRPGDVVTRGQYIADSGNTGYSSGPHLHFVVVRNAGMKLESVPVSFAAPMASTVVPATGMSLTSY